MRSKRGLRWGALGFVSGTVSTLSIFIPHWLQFEGAVEAGIGVGQYRLLMAPVSVLPGLIFGVIIGAALRRARLASGGRIPAYAVAATLSHFLAVQLTVNFLVERIESSVAFGVAAGAFGAAPLAAASAAIMPVFRRGPTTTAMVLTGAALGATLYFPLVFGDFLSWLLLFATWQAGYAAAMATVRQG